MEGAMNELSPRDGVSIAAIAIAFHYSLATHVSGPFTGAVSSLALIGVPWIAARRERLGVVWPARRYLLAGLVIGLTASCALVRVDPLAIWFGHDPYAARDRQLQPLALALVTGCVLYPVGEELVFRGVLVRSLASAWRWPSAIAVAAIAFSLYHHSPYQLFFTLVAGAILGFLTLASRSIVPSMLAHLANNLVIILLQYDAIPGLNRAIDHNSNAVAVACALLTFTAVWFVARRDGDRSVTRRSPSG
jgi:membrane protease YdiL (CAAX protease family)